jgi:outer membrane biosynthesis protein TonB
MNEEQKNKEELNLKNEEQQNDFTEKKSLGSRKGMIALLFILIVLMLYGFLHSALKSDKKEDVNEPQTKVVKDIKSETNKADYGEQNKRLQKEKEHEENQEIPYQKVQTPTVDPVAAEEAKAAATAAANAAKEAQAAAAKAAAAEEAAASSAIKFNINNNSSNNDKPANQGKSGYIQVIQ